MRSFLGVRTKVWSSTAQNSLDGAGETLVLLGVVVLEADLEVDGLHKLALLGLLGILEHLLHALVQGLLGNLTAKVQKGTILNVRFKQNIQ